MKSGNNVIKENTKDVIEMVIIQYDITNLLQKSLSKFLFDSSHNSYLLKRWSIKFVSEKYIFFNKIDEDSIKVIKKMIPIKAKKNLTKKNFI